MNKILSLDGGGVRGIIQATILADFERSTGCRVCDTFSLVAGTSTGGILACCAALGMPMSRVVQFYLEESPVIFKKRWWRLQGLNVPRYPASNIEPVLERYFGDKRLSDCLCDIMVTTYDYAQGRSVFMTSHEVKEEERNRSDFSSSFPSNTNWYLRQVARRTSAAPTYFPLAEDRYADGGVFANHPDLFSITEIQKRGVPLSDIQMLSIGTGSLATAKPPSLGLQGAIGILPHLSDIFMNSGADAFETSSRADLGDRYVRVQTDLAGMSTAMDDGSTEHLVALHERAKETIRKNGIGFWNRWV